MDSDIIFMKKDNVTKKKTPFQLQSLEKYYSVDKYPERKVMEAYATLLNLTFNQIRIWFKERRRKEKKESDAHGCSNNQGKIGCDASSRRRKPCNPKSRSTQRKYILVSSNNRSSSHKNHCIRHQDLLPKDYILKRIFRKDGPPLGVEFDSCPSSSNSHRDSGIIHSCRDSLGVLKKRKISGSFSVERGAHQVQDVNSKKFGIGKGLMTLWRTTNLTNAKLPSEPNFVDGGETSMQCNSSFKDTLFRTSRGEQQQKVNHGSWQRKFQEKRRPPLKKKKVPSGKDVKQNKLDRAACKLSLDESILEKSRAITHLVDDEELELRELQAGPNPLRCPVHLASEGRHGCPLCKDMLARFPPQIVKMGLPFCSRPWDTSPELVKKLFNVLRFLYSNAASTGICPFTVDELAQAFTDKDSMLLGKIHVALLKLLLLDIQIKVAAGFLPRAAKDARFLRFLHCVREKEIDVNIWSQLLNPLTWTEILRQVLVAAGFGSKCNSARREIFKKERNLMAKYGLHPGSLKGKLFVMLLEQGSSGGKVTELAKSSEIVALDLPDTKEGLEDLICSTLSSDVTLFEKIAPSAYRLRIIPYVKRMEDIQSDSEDSGSVDDLSGDESDSSEELNTAKCRQKIARYRGQHHLVDENAEIDESYSGEAWVLGLMEGEYSNLSIEEKLDALMALIDLAGACSSFRKEESIRATSAIITNTWYGGSGAKIKKSLTVEHLMPENPEIIFGASSKGHCSTRTISVTRDEAADDGHLMQSICLGSDRRYNSYWLFLGPCDINEPGHRQIYFESSEDGHWEVINTAEAMDALLSALDCRGTREAHLFASLHRREAFLCQAMDAYKTTECRTRRTNGHCPSTLDTNSGSGSSPISDVDNILDSMESADSHSGGAGPMILGPGKDREEKKQKWDRIQAFDKWVWNDFYSDLNAVKKRKCSYMESLNRCESCHDLYLRDEKHCRMCHTTFDLDFDLEERYAVHVATCRVIEECSEFPNNKLRPSQLQALKAAIHAIEAAMPEDFLSAAWTRSAHKLWVKRLQRTSSLTELLQVLVDFVGTINEEWQEKCASALEEIIVYFQTMPQTTSAVALWMVKLDNLIAPYLDKARSEQAAETRTRPKRKVTCIN